MVLCDCQKVRSYIGLTIWGMEDNRSQSVVRVSDDAHKAIMMLKALHGVDNAGQVVELLINEYKEKGGEHSDSLKG